MSSPRLLSILIPVYNESECPPMLYERLNMVASQLPCEVEMLFVNDGSTDGTLGIIRAWQQSDARISWLDLSRNFGKETAICAGIDYIRGDALVIIDADLQDPPEMIPQMLRELENGYDDVYACRTSRKGETWFKQWTSKMYYRSLKKLSNIPVQENTGDFRMFSAGAIVALRELKERERNMKGLFSFIGFRKKALYYERDSRVAGRTKWNYFSLVNLAVKGLTSFSTVPLRAISITGFTVSILAFVYLAIVLFKALLWGDPVGGYPSLMCVILFLGGITLLALGIIGEYLGIIYSETKKRPVYYVNEYSDGSKCKIHT
jgi:glycosyltransferase involved in cell wall biosynthesis